MRVSTPQVKDTTPPCGEEGGAGHDLHALVEAWASPRTRKKSSSHTSHAVDPWPYVVVPSLQGSGTVLPAGQVEPTGHCVHSSSFVRFVAAEYEPSGHG